MQPPEPSGLLPTPSSTPEPRAPATRLTVAGISECEAKFSNSDVLGRALDALPDPTGPDDDYRLVTLDRDAEDEYIVSARRFGRAEIRDAYEQVWSRLDADHSLRNAVTPPPRAVDVPTSSAQLYMTPPSSPERELSITFILILYLTYPCCVCSDSHAQACTGSEHKQSKPRS